MFSGYWRRSKSNATSSTVIGTMKSNPGITLSNNVISREALKGLSQRLNCGHGTCDVGRLKREEFLSRGLGDRCESVCMFLLHMLEEVSDEPAVPEVRVPVLVQYAHRATNRRVGFLRSTILRVLQHVLEDARHFFRRVVIEMNKFIEA